MKILQDLPMPIAWHESYMCLEENITKAQNNNTKLLFPIACTEYKEDKILLNQVFVVSLTISLSSTIRPILNPSLKEKAKIKKPLTIS